MILWKNIKRNYGNQSHIAKKKDFTSKKNQSNIYFRENMQSDLNEYQTALNHESNANTRIRSLQDKINQDKKEYDDVKEHCFVLTNISIYMYIIYLVFRSDSNNWNVLIKII